MLGGALALGLLIGSTAADAHAAEESTLATAGASADEAPPPPPYAKGLVVDGTIGALGFLGQFRKLAPPGPWFHGQIGYEFFNWLMLFGEGELAFTDTSNLDNPPNVRSFDMWGFGGGARFTWHITERVGIYGQPTLGMLKADVPKNTLGLHGFTDAEELNLWIGFRAGVEWFQIDRHMALGLTTAIRYLPGFEKTGQGVSKSSDTPLGLDGGLSLRYAF